MVTSMSRTRGHGIVCVAGQRLKLARLPEALPIVM
jgi:hypothetical protein